MSAKRLTTPKDTTNRSAAEGVNGAREVTALSVVTVPLLLRLGKKEEQ
jgi:hypothetical protein